MALLNCLAFMTVCIVNGAGESRQLLRQMSDPSTPIVDRVQIETALMESPDASLLRPLLQLQQDIEWPVYCDEMMNMEIMGHSAESQIRCSHARLWRHFAQHAQPEEVRKQIILDLFGEYGTTRQLRALFEASIWNHSPELEQKLWDIFADREQDAGIRSGSMNTLVVVAPRKYTRQIIELAWEERGSEVATNVGGRLGGPRYRDSHMSALKLDWYDREQARSAEHARPVSEAVLDRMDSYFGNVSGLYIKPRSAEADRRFYERRDKRLELSREARETGDDTELREFEAELAAKQQAELEERIEKIDAWIAANRDRVEAEAAEYARTRGIERDQEGERERD